MRYDLFGDKKGIVMTRDRNIDIGQVIRRERMRLGLSQIELAKLIDTQPQQLSRWENGRITPGLEAIRAIADALAIDERDLTGESWPILDNQNRKPSQLFIEGLVARFTEEQREKVIKILLEQKAAFDAENKLHDEQAATKA